MLGQPIRSAKKEQVKCLLRIRPLLPSETQTSFIKCLNDSEIEVRDIRSLNKSFIYKFDACFDENSQQQSIFEQLKPILEQVLAGKNATIFAYGITGTGKTYTMDGNQEQPGMIPLSVQYLFDQKSNKNNSQISFEFSRVEIYNEKVFDLTKTDRIDLPLRQDANGNIIISNLQQISIPDYQTFLSTYKKTTVNRSTASTLLNEDSSRSHSVLRIEIKNEKGGKLLTSKLYLIDLAGSEDNRKTGNNKDRMVESGNINKSLFMLNQVVEALNANAQAVPYRNSKLTRLLQDSLGGKSLALMITCIAPTLDYYLDTMNTLNMARRTREIRNSVELQPIQIIKEEPKNQLVKKTQTINPLQLPAKRKTSTDSQGSSKQMKLSDPLQREEKIIFAIKSLNSKKTSFTNKVDPSMPLNKVLPFLSPKTLANVQKGMEKAKKVDIVHKLDLPKPKPIELANLTKEVKTKPRFSDASYHPDQELSFIGLELDEQESKEKEEENSKRKRSAGKENLKPKKSFETLNLTEEELPEWKQKAIVEILKILNSGQLKLIQTLNGIGKTKAKIILQHHKENGNFESLDQLSVVNIKEKSQEKIIMKIIEELREGC